MTLSLAEQLDRHVELGYPALASLSEEEYRERARPAVEAPISTPGGAPGADGPGTRAVARLLVVTRAVVPDEARVPLLRLPGSSRAGILDRNHSSDARAGLVHYQPLAELGVEGAEFYVAEDVDRGDEFRDVAPHDALPAIASRGRTPLTIDEGLSLLAAFPDALVPNHCFMLAGSSRGDKRVPALWISEKAPKLGWCFRGVPHTWLGVASLRGRTMPAGADR